MLVNQRKEKYERTKINTDVDTSAGVDTNREEYGATKDSSIGFDNRG